MKKFRVGVIGLGFIGMLHVEALRRLGFVEVVAVSDSYDVQAKAEAIYVDAFYDDYKLLIDEQKPDAIHICTPNDSHYEIAMYAMERKINVICEKPLAINVEQAVEMQKTADQNKLICGINYSNRFNPLVMQMKEMVRSGELGEIHSVHGSYLQDWLLYDTDYSWRLESGVSGKSRAFADIGSHWLDAVENVTGLKVIELLADLKTIYTHRKRPLGNVMTFSNVLEDTPMEYEEIPIDTEDSVNLLFHFDNGAMGSCCISQVFAGRKNQIVISIGGANRSLYWDSETSNELWVGRRDGNNEQIVKDPSLLSPKAAAISSYPGGHSEGFADTIKHNFAAIYAAIMSNNEKDTEFATFDDGVREMILCEKIIQSSAEKRWVAVE